ncbi:MAG: 2-hydroxymuconate tautomerase family protein [Methanobacteriaceae archaeon]|nr:2-hydroxymuconate tautomerase family protein [Methanobacteriaceae archaeon]
MPVVTIAGNVGISEEKLREMVEEVTKSVAKAYDLPESTITILVQEYPANHVGAGGKLLSDLHKE